MNTPAARSVYKSVQAGEHTEVARVMHYSLMHRRVTQGSLFMV